jgi:release factor glutamine methyltransferase
VDIVSFSGLDLRTNVGRVMTPRPASEQLVAYATEAVGERAARVVDVGTGSGAVALAIAAALPLAEVFATDTSAEAVALARLNARRLGLAERVTVLHGDLLDPVPGRIDLIVANLPYLPAASAPFHPELAGEPPAAVYAPDDGLDPYRSLIAAARERLTESGLLAIQFHRRVFAAERGELDVLAGRLDALSDPLTLPLAA